MKRKFCILLTIILCLWVFAVPVAAASLYHSPAMTILTENAPRDLEIMIRLHRKDGSEVPIILDKKTKLWEQQFRLYREAGFSIRAWYGNHYDLEDAELILRSGGEERVLAMPREMTDQMSMNDVVMLDYKAGTLSLGDPLWRGMLMMVLRILVAVAVELLVFRLRKYSDLRTYLAVGLGSLAGFGFMGWYTSGWLNFDVRAIIPFIVLLFLTLTAEILLNLILVEEEPRDKTLVTTVLSFCPAAVLTILMLYFLPV